jgi:hypothetical protein
VAAEMVAMAPGTVQLNIFAWNQKLTKYTEKYVWKLTKYELIFWNIVSSHHCRSFTVQEGRVQVQECSIELCVRVSEKIHSF